MTISTAQQHCGDLKDQLLISQLLKVETILFIARQFKIRVIQITISHKILALKIVITAQRLKAARTLGINMRLYMQQQRCAFLGERRRKVTYSRGVYTVSPEIRL